MSTRIVKITLRIRKALGKLVRVSVLSKNSATRSNLSKDTDSHCQNRGKFSKRGPGHPRLALKVKDRINRFQEEKKSGNRKYSLENTQ